MAILDDVIGVFSPGWKAARLRSRAVIQAYEAVKTTRTHKARRENRTADQLSQYGAVSLRGQARYLDNNHDLVIGVFDKLEERVVGKNGIIVEPHPVLRNGAIARDLAAEISGAFLQVENMMFLKQDTFNYEKQSVVLSELSGLQRIEYLAFVQQRTAKFDAGEGELPEAERQIAFLRMGMDINAWLVSRSLWKSI